MRVTTQHREKQEKKPRRHGGHGETRRSFLKNTQMKSHARSLVVLLRRTNTLVQDCWNQFAIRVSLRSASVELRALCVSVVSSNRRRTNERERHDTSSRLDLVG